MTYTATDITTFELLEEATIYRPDGSPFNAFQSNSFVIKVEFTDGIRALVPCEPGDVTVRAADPAAFDASQRQRILAIVNAG